MTQQKYQDFWAGGFLYDRAAQAVFLHKRDGKTKINPHKWAFFGGQNEGDETYVECFIREFQEEIGLKVLPTELKHLCEYMNTLVNQYRVVFYVESTVREEELVLGEGAGFAWIKLSEVFQYDLADRTCEDLRYFLAQPR
jgi:8-oxo-dGTP pyrophosphatase MutT (NUDIX family)